MDSDTDACITNWRSTGELLHQFHTCSCPTRSVAWRKECRDPATPSNCRASRAGGRTRKRRRIERHLHIATAALVARTRQQLLCRRLLRQRHSDSQVHIPRLEAGACTEQYVVDRLRCSIRLSRNAGAAARNAGAASRRNHTPAMRRPARAINRRCARTGIGRLPGAAGREYSRGWDSSGRKVRCAAAHAGAWVLVERLWSWRQLQVCHRCVQRCWGTLDLPQGEEGCEFT